MSEKQAPVMVESAEHMALAVKKKEGAMGTPYGDSVRFAEGESDTSLAVR